MSKSLDNNAQVKLACERCIKGHRTSTCTHLDGSKGRVLAIKKRGRPPSQCSHCRERREKDGRHIKCTCVSRKNNGPTTTRSYPPVSGHADSPLSFSNILNPCRCESTGICRCCTVPFEGLKNNPISRKPYDRNATTSGAGCCGSKGAEDSTQESSLHLLIQAADMSRAYEPQCMCREDCACGGCGKRTQPVKPKEVPEEPTPPIEIPKEDCKSCTACDLGLMQPSGVDAIDHWEPNTDTKRVT